MRPIKISKKEWGLAVLAACLALASLKPSDPYVVFPMLAGSFMACLFLAYHHEGGSDGKVLFLGVVTVVLGFMAYRECLDIKSIPKPSPTPSPTFFDEWRITLQTAFMGGSRGLKSPYPFGPETISGIWILYRGSFGDSASPANMAIFLRVTNLLSDPQRVELMTIEALGLNTGRWAQLTRLPLAFNRACYGFNDLRGAAIISFPDNALDRLLSSPIEPGESGSISGWDLLEYPDGFAFSGVPLRITVRDGIGRTQQLVVPFPQKDSTNSGSIDLKQELNFVGGRQDLSSFHRGYWSTMHAQ